MRVKVCGITRPQDALAAERAGADAIGLIFAPHSKRRVTLPQAEAICTGLGPFMLRVGVFLDQPLAEVRAVARQLRLDAVQLHGHEDAAYAHALREERRVIRAVAFSPALTPEELDVFPADGFLLDAATPGSGQVFDWEVAARFRKYPRLVVAGGLTPENVAMAVRVLEPNGVDVASGVEVSPGVKDAALIAHFVARAKGVRCA